MVYQRYAWSLLYDAVPSCVSYHRSFSSRTKSTRTHIIVSIAIAGNTAKMGDVTDIVKQYNIQLDNLCQFLPQDKVVEFARLKPIELLWATEAAVGDTTLASTHEELLKVRTAYEREKHEVDEIQSFVDRLVAENARSERSVAQIRERERLLQEAEDYKSKVPWAEYKKAKEEYDAEVEKLKHSEDQLKTLEKEQKKGDTPVRDKQRELDAAKGILKKAKQELDAVKVPPLVKEAQSLSDKAAKKSDEIMGIEANALELERKIAMLERTIAELRAQAEDTSHVEREIADVDKQIEMAKRCLRDLGTQGVALEQDKSQLDLILEEVDRSIKEKERRLASLNDKKKQRLRQLDMKVPGTEQAWNWLQSNKSKFRGKVYGPLVVEVDVQDPLHARMLEQHVANTWWNHFVVEHPEDQDLLKSELNQNFKYRANVTYYSGDSTLPLQHPQGQWADYARFGCIASLDQVFQAPQVVKHVLNDNAYIASTFVLSNRDANYQGMYEANPDIQVIFTPDSQIRRRKSRYNHQAVSYTHSPLKQVTLLIGSSFHQNGGGPAINDDAMVAGIAQEMPALRTQKQELQGKIAGIRNSMAELETRRNEAVRENKTLSDKRRKLQRKISELKADIDRKEKELTRRKNQPDPRNKRPALQRELDDILGKLLSVSDKLGIVHSKYVEKSINMSYAELSCKELNDQVDKLAAATRDRSERVRAMADAVQQYRRLVGGLKQTMDNHKKDAKDATGWPLPAELEEKFAGMPNDPFALRELAQSKQDEAEGLMITDPSALEHYKRRCEEISAAEETLKELVEKRDLNAARIEELKAAWLPQLRDIVNRINETFSVSFPNVGVAGEVALREAEDDDFSKYAIEIRVKFRDNEQLSVLDANRQSGGERSVSTILYLVALQGVAAAPFRVVDEINQGMDQYNERKAFKLLVDAATAPDTAQCFLLTPKLLPDLPFSSEVTVLQIFNGVHINSVAQGFSQEKVLGRERMAMLTAVGAS